jgi:hypothetical protein
MTRTYDIAGHEVRVTWVYRHHPAVSTITINGTPVPGSIEKTVLGRFLAVDGQGRLLGTFPGLRAAVEHVVHAERG